MGLAAEGSTDILVCGKKTGGRMPLAMERSRKGKGSSGCGEIKFNIDVKDAMDGVSHNRALIESSTLSRFAIAPGGRNLYSPR
jgi:hypothetical protein